ncbi:MAG: biotin--[acetyl-CoA-carboxylase] ligase, partial [Sphingosinicella sp.]
RTWLSPAGNLYASTLVRLQAGDPPAPTLALVAGIALHEVVARYVPDVQIKWPNDLMVERFKLAGILLEREGEAVVIGLGVNLAAAPDGLDRPATSVAAQAAKAPLPGELLEELAVTFGHWLARWRGEGLAPVRTRWLEDAHPIGTLLASADGKGHFAGIDEQGALQLQGDDGSVKTIRAGDVFPI